MSPRPSTESPGGFTLLEITIVLVAAGVILMMAAPNLTGLVRDVRARGALDRVATSMYYARGAAVETGRSAQLVLRSADGCIANLEIVTGSEGQGRHKLPGTFESGDACLQHTGDS